MAYSVPYFMKSPISVSNKHIMNLIRRYPEYPSLISSLNQVQNADIPRVWINNS